MWVVLWRKKNSKKLGITGRRVVHARGASTWLGARVPCTIVMAIDGCEVYIVMFWDHVGGFVEKQNYQKILA